MRLGVLQIPYANTEDGAEAAVAAAIDALNGCHEACDVILTPEYTNAPAHFDAGRMMPFAAAHTEALLQAARAAACRCHAVVAMNYLCETEPGVFRNTTEILDRSGRSAGRFFKQHLTEAEQEIAGLDSTYTRQFRPPTVVEVDGIRFACVICYDIYFSEYVSQIAHGRPDVILVPSFQRGERKEIIRMQNQYLAFRCNSFVVRASVSMGARARLGGMSLIAAPDGRILKEWSNRCGLFFCEVGDIKQKYMRGNGFGGKMIAGDRFVEQSRETWAYRPCGSMTVESEACMGYPRICAHRGFNTVAPENSLAAFGAAIALGAPEIELDVRFTRDGIPVVAHDSELQRQAGVPGTIEEKTLAELEQLDFNHGGNRHFAHTKIATLEQVLAQFARHVIINLHLKSGEGEYPRSWMKKILDLLERLNRWKPVWVELGLQTIHASTAAYIRRGYPLSCFETALEELHRREIPVIVHTILGLPFETEEMVLDTMHYLNRQPVSGIKLQLLHVLKHTDLAKDYLDGKFQVLDRDAYLTLVMHCLAALRPDLVIHRLTGDGPKDLLIAPLWSQAKRSVLNDLHRRLKEAQIWQGKDLGFRMTDTANGQPRPNYTKNTSDVTVQDSCF